MRYSILLFVFLAPAACSRASQSPATLPPQAAAAAAAATPRAVTYGPGTNRYRIVSHAHQEQQIEGNKQEATFMLEALTTVTLTPEAASRLRFTLVIDSLRAEGGMISPAEVSRARGTRLNGVLGPEGQITDFGGDSVLTGQLQNFAASVKLFFPRLPTAGAEPGQLWTDTVETRTSGTTQLTLHSINDRRVVGWTEQAGQRALHIEVAGRYTIVGTGQQMGQQFTIDGDGRRLTHQYLSADGRYLGSNTRDSSSVTIALTALGMTLPSVQSRADTVSVIP